MPLKLPVPFHELDDETGWEPVPGGAPSYACGPPSTEHGPFTSAQGCVFFEIQYYIGGA
jgi:hypothetical protein